MDRPWFLTTVALSCVTVIALVFSVWELIEYRYFRDFDYRTLHFLYVTRGIAGAVLTGIWASWFILRDRRRQEEELQQSYEHYRSILNHMPDAVMLIDEEYRVAEWNEAAERLFGYSGRQVLGNRVPNIPADRWDEFRQILHGINETEKILDHETERVTANGERIPVAASYSRIPAIASRPSFYVEVLQDIRPRLSMRDKLLELEKLTLTGQLAAGAAHHLNTPLTAMLLQIELLRLQVTEPDQVEELGVIEQRIRFCQAFVQNFLQFARRPDLQERPTVLGDLIDISLGLFQPSLKLKRATFEIDCDNLGSSRVMGDPSHLEAMLSALISNAVDVSQPGDVIRIHGKLRSSALAEIHLDDEGPGIPEEIMPHIFEPFFTTKPSGKGTGLGLAIARNIAELHGGGIHLQNRKERGLRVTLHLPVLQEHGPLRHTATEAQTCR